MTVIACGVTASTWKVARPSWTSSSHSSGLLVAFGPPGQKLRVMPETFVLPRAIGYWYSPPISGRKLPSNVGADDAMKSSPDRVTRAEPAFDIVSAV